jgi:type II secretory pathway component PulF
MADEQSSANDHMPGPGDRVPYALLHRLGLYAFAWLPALAAAVFLVPVFGPVYERLDRHGELPWITERVWSFSRFNHAFGSVPVVLLFTLFCTVGEFTSWLARRCRYERLCVEMWHTAIVCTGALMLLGLAWACQTPVFKFGSVVTQGTRAEPIYGH